VFVSFNGQGKDKLDKRLEHKKRKFIYLVFKSSVDMKKSVLGVL
jgi:hypothetical protein